MPKARSAAEKRKFAEAKGYTANIDAIDSKAVPRAVLDCTKEMYRVQIALWEELKEDLY
ncbi:hypothetical protein V8F33_012557 [Rhypophila sp. PSN 637]